MSDGPPEIGQGVLEELVDEEGVRKLIECPICLEIPLPPIYLCAKGHIVCNSCQSRTYACPLCRERYCNTRSFVAEGIVEKCYLKCRYFEGGCKVTMKGSELGDHLNCCEFRPVKCRECGDKPINYCEYEKHLFKDHKLSGTSGDEAYVAYRINLNFMQRSLVDTCFWPQYYIKAFDKIFLLRLNAHQFSINPWVCLLGSQSDCSKYTALIEYEPSADGSIVQSWKGPVNHFRDEPLDIIAQGKALCVPMDTILESGAISADRAEWIYHIVLYEKAPNEFSSTINTILCEEGTNNVDTSISSEMFSRGKESSSDLFIPGPSSTSGLTGIQVEEEQSTQRLSQRISQLSNKPSSTHPEAIGVSGVCPTERRTKCTIHCQKKTGRFMDSAGSYGDVEDSSDYD